MSELCRDLHNPCPFTHTHSTDNMHATRITCTHQQAQTSCRDHFHLSTYGKHVWTTNYCMLLKDGGNQRKGDFKNVPESIYGEKTQGSGASCWYLSVSSILYSNWDVWSRMQVDMSVITLGGSWDLPMCYLCQICQWVIYGSYTKTSLSFTCLHPVRRVKINIKSKSKQALFTFFFSFLVLLGMIPARYSNKNVCLHNLLSKYNNLSTQLFSS